MRVLRVEHESDGKGPYHRGGAYHCDFDLYQAKSSFPPRHPTPFAEGLQCHPVYRCRGPLYGFADRQSAISWFGPAAKELSEMGYVLAEYEVDPAAVGQGAKQVIFNPKAARKVATKPLTTIAEP